MECSDDLITLLQAGVKAEQSPCGVYLYNLSPIEQQSIYQTLEMERLMNKYLVIRDQHERDRLSWEQIAFNYIMKYIGDMSNRQNYVEVAMRVGYKTLMRERESLMNIEALLIGAAGLLSTLPRDRFSEEFVRQGEYLLHKYQIEPLKRSAWRSIRMSLSRAPIMRLSQMANVIYRNSMIFNSVVNCKTRDDVHNIFNVAASEELSRYFGGVKRHIGVDVCDIVGINVVVMLLYAYGQYSSNEEMIYTANDLNESLPAEQNGIISRWRRSGLVMSGSYQTQALIELQTSYCAKKRCAECHLYKHMRSKVSIIGKLPLVFLGIKV